MFISLFLKECKLILKSITYYILSICIIVFIIFQMGEFKLSRPIPDNENNFGYTISNDKSLIMKKTVEKLRDEYDRNEYSTYPIGFIKVVKLNDEDKEKISKILDDIDTCKININDEEDFDKFLEEMNTVSKIIGKGSSYEADEIKKTSVPATYEQSLERYNDILYEDHVSGAVARNFCDYAGIITSIMPVFLAVSVCLRDKKSKAEQVIYASRTSTAAIVLTRYLAVISMLLIPVIIAAIYKDSQCIYFAESLGIEPDYLAFSKGILGWILPGIMISTASGFLFTELFKGIEGIFIQLALWFFSVLSNGNLIGGVGYNLIPRFNTLGARDIYLSVFNELVINRILYTVLSIILIALTILIYNYRRRGVVNGKVLSTFKG